MSRLLVAIVLSLGICGAVQPAAAQVCGDADGNGTVSVLDGVQTLRAAAGLESLCTLAACDVDGNGSITVTDGVNVLRKSAGLAIVETCGGSVAGQPATVLAELQAVFKYGVGFATGTPVTSCANPEDGEIDVEVDGDETITSFSSCQVDSLLLYGDIVVAPGLLTFSVFESDTLDDDFIADFDGEVTLGTAGAGRSLTGTVDISTESAGFFVMDLNGVVVTGGVLTGGSATVNLEDSDIVDAFTGFTLTFDGSGVANVTATEAGGGTSTYRFDIATGAVTQ